MKGGFAQWLSGKESTCNAGAAGDAGSIPGSGRSPEEDTSTNSIIAAWRSPWTEEPGRLQPTGSQRVWRSQTQLEPLSRMKGVYRENVKWEERKVFLKKECHRKVRILWKRVISSAMCSGPLGEEVNIFHWVAIMTPPKCCDLWS